MTQSHRPLGPGDHLFLIDGSSFVFRAYFQSIRQDQKYNYRSDRLPVGAVRLFAAKVLQFLRDGAAGVMPTHIAMIFDKSEESFRRELYPAYKAHRPEPPEDLVPQFPLMRATVRAFGLTPIEQDRYEADDLIATYARLARERGADVLIVSADKDLMQLIEPGVAMFDPASGTGDTRREERRIGMTEVIEYFGVPPEKVVDVQALAGDSTDNVPGAPGIGVKTAAQLITEYGSLEALLERAGEIKQPKRRETLTKPETVELIRISKQLVTLVRDVELEAPIDSLGLPTLEGEKLIAFLKAMEFTTITRRVSEICGVDANGVEPDPAFVGPAGWRARDGTVTTPPAPSEPVAPKAAAAADEPTPRSLASARAAHARTEGFDLAKYQTVRTLAELDAWIARAFEAGVVAFDTETSSLDPIRADLVGASLAIAPGEACYIPINHVQGEGLFGEGRLPDQLDEAEVIARLKPLLEVRHVLKVGQNVKFDWHIFKQRGVEVAPFDDTMLMSYALDSGANNEGHGMDGLSERWLGHKPIAFAEVAGSGRNFIGFARAPIDKATAYAAEDADVTLRLWRVLKPRLVAEGLTTVYETLERPLIAALARMEARGVSIDRNILSRLSGEFAQGMARIEAEIQTLVGVPLNLGSPKQISDVLFGQMGLPGGKKTPTGAWSTNASVLEDLAEEGHELPRKILELAPALQAQVDLHRRAAGLRQPEHAPRPHQLRARRDDDGPPVVFGAEPAKHPDPQRGRPPHSSRLRFRGRMQAHFGRL